MKKILIFVASGLSTRMGGNPKGLCKINNVPVIVHAIRNAQPYYDNIYVVTNFKILHEFENAINEFALDAKVRAIITGKGDAESVLKSIKLVLAEQNTNDFDCTFCWGDAFFLSETVFSAMSETNDITNLPSIQVGCSVDNDPYAYFDIYTQRGDLSNAKVAKSYFKKRDGAVTIGMHDQCIFRCSAANFIACIDQYQNHLGYDGENYTKSPTGEMGLLNSFEFFNHIKRPVEIKLIPSGLVYSFNTKEELDELQHLLNQI